MENYVELRDVRKIFKTVVFPAPLAPTTTANSPFFT